MNQQQVYQFVLRFFQAFDSQFLEKGPDFLKVKLPVQLDKALTNRPFYWNYVESTVVEPETMTLSLSFASIDESDDPTLRIEKLFFGSKRLDQVMQVASAHGRFIRLYETQPPSVFHQTQAYVPWQCLNYKVEMLSDQKKDIFYSIGYNLHSGQFKPQFFDDLNQLTFTPVMPPRAYKLEPQLTVDQAVQHVEQFILTQINQMDDGWAVEANQRLAEEMERIKHYYRFDTNEAPIGENQSGDDHHGEKREAAIREMATRISEAERQYRPHIRLTLCNTGLFYLTPKSSFDLPASTLTGSAFR